MEYVVIYRSTSRPDEYISIDAINEQFRNVSKDPKLMKWAHIDRMYDDNETE